MNKEIVLIEWFDAKGVQRWEYLDEIEPMPSCLCYSVGFIIEDTTDYKTIALGLSETQVLGRTTIPTGCIRRIEKLATSFFSSSQVFLVTIDSLSFFSLLASNTCV